jgi:hypothetical protein
MSDSDTERRSPIFVCVSVAFWYVVGTLVTVRFKNSRDNKHFEIQCASSVLSSN